MCREFAAVLGLSLASLGASAAAGSPGPSPAAPAMSAATINDASPNGANDKRPPLIAKAETLLDRAHFSPGEIDGLDGDNFHSAVRAFQETNSLAVTGNLDADTWNALARNATAAVLKAYTISDADVSGPFTKVIPTNLEGMAKLPGLSYTGPLAEIAEKFHMAPAYPESAWGVRVLSLATVYDGPAADGEQATEPLLKLGDPVIDFSDRMDYRTLQKLYDGLFPKGRDRCYWKSTYLARLDDEVIGDIVTGMALSLIHI